MSKSSSIPSTITTTKPHGNQKEISPEDTVKRLASIGMHGNDIAKILGIGRTTLYERFRTQMELGRAEGNAKLLQEAEKRAMSRSDAILMFLLKNRVGYTDKIDHSVINEPGVGLKEELRLLWSEIEQVTGWRDVTPGDANESNTGNTESPLEGERQEIRGDISAPSIDRGQGGQPTTVQDGNKNSNENG